MFSPSLASSIKNIAPYISPDLISPANFDRIYSIAQYFSRTYTPIFKFETCLTDSEGIADFFFCVESDGNEKEWLGVNKKRLFLIMNQKIRLIGKKNISMRLI